MINMRSFAPFFSNFFLLNKMKIWAFVFINFFTTFKMLSLELNLAFIFDGLSSVVENTFFRCLTYLSLKDGEKVIAWVEFLTSSALSETWRKINESKARREKHESNHISRSLHDMFTNFVLNFLKLKWVSQITD